MDEVQVILSPPALGQLTCVQVCVCPSVYVCVGEWDIGSTQMSECVTMVARLSSVTFVGCLTYFHRSPGNLVTHQHAHTLPVLLEIGAFLFSLSTNMTFNLTKLVCFVVCCDWLPQI